MRRCDCVRNLDTPLLCADDNEVRILECRALVQGTAGTRLGITLHVE